MMDSTERSYRAKKVIVLSLFIVGIASGLMGVVSIALGRSSVVVNLLLLFGGFGAIALARLLELLTDIAYHLAALKTQQSFELLTDIADHLADIRNQPIANTPAFGQPV